MPCPDFSFEAAARSRGFLRVAGLDEVGRGPLAGPVTAAAVILNPADIPAGLRDSKQLDAPRREALSAEIRSRAEVAVAHASVEEIDTVNILAASQLAMCRALEALPRPADFALIDGNRMPEGLRCPGETIVKGDACCLSIAAASIVAKVARDELMRALSLDWPGYGWETNVGYGTAAHVEALERLGPTPLHRRSFAPLRNMLCEDRLITS